MTIANCIAAAYERGRSRAESDPRVAHSMRFRRVSTGYPRVVALAYDRDIAAAARDDDEQVAARVEAWEQANGWPVRDWTAISRDERGDDAT